MPLGPWEVFGGPKGLWGLTGDVYLTALEVYGIEMVVLVN